MTHLKTSVLLLLLSSVAACGAQVVEFALDGGPDGSADGSMDAALDATEAGPDEGTDTSADQSADSAFDATADAGSDRNGDVSSDGSRDVSSEQNREAAPDGAGDATEENEASLAPMVIATTPLSNATGVSINDAPTATFNEAMSLATINALTFTLTQGATPVSGAVSYVGTTATFTPTVALGLNLPYTATITTGATSAGGQPLAANYVWTFTTAACSQAPVALGSAVTFVVLAGSTVTSTGPTSLIGDMGVSPGTAITGFPPGTIVGNQHAGDPTAAQAIADLGTAYLDAAGRTLCAITVMGNLGGMTLTPGLYKSTSSLAVSMGDLTLDAQGDSSAVFIFQTASTLTTTSGRQVILANGAKSANIFWQVGTSATLGTTSSFQGTIMADQAVTLSTGATLNGRAFAHIAATALDSNTVVKPLP